MILWRSAVAEVARTGSVSAQSYRSAARQLAHVPVRTAVDQRAVHASAVVAKKKNKAPAEPAGGADAEGKFDLAQVSQHMQQSVQRCREAVQGHASSLGRVDPCTLLRARGSLQRSSTRCA